MTKKKGWSTVNTWAGSTARLCRAMPVAAAASVPSRAEFLDVVRNLAAECQRYGVQISTGVEATAESVRAGSPDVVVLATGAIPQPPYWAGGHPRVVDVRDVLEGRAEPAGQVVVVDDLGFHQATSVAELLADRGCAVEIITPGMVVGQDLGITLDMETFNVRAHAKGIRQATDLVVLAASGADGEDGVMLTLLHHPTGESAQRHCDWVVCAVHQAPEETLWQQLQAAPFEVHRIGDCVTPRRAHAAVIEGHRVAIAI